MTNTNESTDTLLLAVLRAATGCPGLEFDAEPTRLTGGFWAELIGFRLKCAPPGWDGPLVARLMPDAGIAAKETAMQSAVAAQGFATPRVRFAGGVDDGLGRAFLVMDLAAGAPMLQGLAGGNAIGSLPRLARGLPDLLATTMARLHRLDSTPARDGLVAAGFTESGVGPVVASLMNGATNAGRTDLHAAGVWLREHAPVARGEVVCHGDLHPFNVLVDAAGNATVLDWSASLLADPMYDVAFTSLVLAEPPIGVPRPARPLVRLAGRALARRFRRRYEAETRVSIDATSLAWHEGVICLRALVEVAGWGATADERGGHPWIVNGPAFAARLTALTGVVVNAR